MFLRIRPYEFVKVFFCLKKGVFGAKSSSFFLIIFEYQKESKITQFGA